MHICFELFSVFFNIGSFTIGGGYAMIPLIQDEVVYRKKWMEVEEFVDMLSIAQSSPGPIAVNTSVFVGYKIAGLRGAISSTLGCILPSFFIILTIGMAFRGMQDNLILKRTMKTLRPLVAALILSSVISIAKNMKMGLRHLWIPLAVVISSMYFHLSPILFILLGGVGGVLYFSGKERIDRAG